VWRTRSPLLCGSGCTRCGYLGAEGKGLKRMHLLKGLKRMHLLCATHTLAPFGALSAQIPARNTKITRLPLHSNRYRKKTRPPPSPHSRSMRDLLVSNLTSCGGKGWFINSQTRPRKMRRDVKALTARNRRFYPVRDFLVGALLPPPPGETAVSPDTAVSPGRRVVVPRLPPFAPRPAGPAIGDY